MTKIPCRKRLALGASFLLLMLHCAVSFTCPELADRSNQALKESQKQGNDVHITFSGTEGKCSATSDCIISSAATECPTCCIKSTPTTTEAQAVPCILVEVCRDGVAFCWLLRRSTTWMKMLIVNLGGHHFQWLRVKFAASHPMQSSYLWSNGTIKSAD
jgi:hypothetical protein